MGMDYNYSGSASYPRFSQELTDIALLFGITKKTAEPVEGTINYWMGDDFNNTSRYVFSADIPKAVQKFFDTPFEELTVDETKEVKKFLDTKRYSVIKISRQIVEELDALVAYHEGWNIW